MNYLVAPALAALICCLGCAGFVSSPAQTTPLPGDPASYIADIIQEAAAVTDVSGFAKLRIASEAKTSNSRNVFFVQRSGRIRIETLGFLSRPALFFTADPSLMHLYAVESNAFYTGETSAENFSRIIGMPLELAGIISSFLGQPPLLDCPGRTIAAAVRQGQFEYTVTCGNRTERILVDPELRRIRRYSLSEGGAPVYAYTFSQFQKFGSIIFPLKIEIYHYTYKTAVTLTFESLSFDPIPAERFVIRPPQNAQVHSLEQLGGGQ